MLASVHPHTPEPPHYKNHPCSYSLHQPHGLAEQRHKAGTAVPEAHKPCFKSVRAVSRQRLCMPPHTRCCSPAEHQRNSQSSMTVRQTDGQQHLILLPFQVSSIMKCSCSHLLLPGSCEATQIFHFLNPNAVLQCPKPDQDPIRKQPSRFRTAPLQTGSASTK